MRAQLSLGCKGSGSSVSLRSREHMLRGMGAVQQKCCAVQAGIWGGFVAYHPHSFYILLLSFSRFLVSVFQSCSRRFCKQSQGRLSEGWFRAWTGVNVSS